MPDTPADKVRVHVERSTGEKQTYLVRRARADTPADILARRKVDHWESAVEGGSQ